MSADSATTAPRPPGFISRTTVTIERTRTTRMSCMPASYQNLKKIPEFRRFCNSPPTGRRFRRVPGARLLRDNPLHVAVANHAEQVHAAGEVIHVQKPIAMGAEATSEGVPCAQTGAGPEGRARVARGDRTHTGKPSSVTSAQIASYRWRSTRPVPHRARLSRGEA